ncbi:MAG: hypothetical protein Q9M91_04740 [Candidatus Dojkabacteria bacterium]|nr:hypothetical protein [Candidatus Dojkabacteria bacterium]MDQ7021117.1 hypothetical protein [Candidatus Dojkabacteria bacterium]
MTKRVQTLRGYKIDNNFDQESFTVILEDPYAEEYNYRGLVKLTFSLFQGDESLTDVRNSYLYRKDVNPSRNAECELVQIKLPKEHASNLIKYISQSNQNLIIFFDFLLGEQNNFFFRPENIPEFESKMYASLETIQSHPDRFMYKLPKKITIRVGQRTQHTFEINSF